MSDDGSILVVDESFEADRLRQKSLLSILDERFYTASEISDFSTIRRERYARCWGLVPRHAFALSSDGTTLVASVQSGMVQYYLEIMDTRDPFKNNRRAPIQVNSDEPVYSPVLFADPFKSFGYISDDCCVEPVGVRAMNNLVNYFHTTGATN
jgi:hypothetical protein